MTSATAAPQPMAREQSSAPVSDEYIDAPDHLAGGVLRSLARPLAPGLSWGVLKTGIVGIATLGLWPLIDWTRRFTDMARYERTQFWHLAEWLRLSSGRADAAALCEHADSLPLRRFLGMAAVLWGGAALAQLAAVLVRQGAGLQRVVDSTYGFTLFPVEETLRSEAGFVFVAWTVGLSIGYGLHWLRVQLHAADLRRFIEAFNRIAQEESVVAVLPRRIGPGLRPMWVLAAIVLASFNALWGVPMMLAGAAQRRYINIVAAGNRTALAQRVEMLLASQRPVVRRMPVKIGTRIPCRQKLCRTELPQGSRFCPRCGTRVERFWR